MSPNPSGAASALVETGLTSTAKQFTGLTAGVTYTFSIKAVNTYGESASISKDIMPGGAPDAPTNVATSITSDGLNCQISWTAAVANGYVLESYTVSLQKPDGTSYVNVECTPAD